MSLSFQGKGLGMKNLCPCSLLALLWLVRGSLCACSDWFSLWILSCNVAAMPNLSYASTDQVRRRSFSKFANCWLTLCSTADLESENGLMLRDKQVTTPHFLVPGFRYWTLWISSNSHFAYVTFLRLRICKQWPLHTSSPCSCQTLLGFQTAKWQNCMIHLVRIPFSTCMTCGPEMYYFVVSSLHGAHLGIYKFSMIVIPTNANQIKGCSRWEHQFVFLACDALFVWGSTSQIFLVLCLSNYRHTVRCGTCFLLSFMSLTCFLSLHLQRVFREAEETAKAFREANKDREPSFEDQESVSNVFERVKPQKPISNFSWLDFGENIATLF